MCGVRSVLKCLLVFGILGIAPFAGASAKNTVKVLHSFLGSDGANPDAPLIMDSVGNLYGTTFDGGANGVGNVFKLAPDGTETVLYNFGVEGFNPAGSLLADETGNLYGTTSGGGNSCPYNSTCGTVFKLAPDGTYTTLHFFGGGDDGASPTSGLIADANGNLYGTTSDGGGLGAPICGVFGCGTIYKLAPDGTETVLYRFSGVDGVRPEGNLTFDAKGNLYGTTQLGGNLSQPCPSAPNGCGTVFKLSKDGREKVLYNFCSKPHCQDGSLPSSSVIFDKTGNLYGTTPQGGASTYCEGPFSCGVVFKLSESGVETVLYNFCSISRCADGMDPQDGLIMDKLGNFYGTTDIRGNVFRVAPDGTETVVSKFRCKHQICSDGSGPLGGLIADKKFERLYGVTALGGSENLGVVFSVTP